MGKSGRVQRLVATNGTVEGLGGSHVHDRDHHRRVLFLFFRLSIPNEVGCSLVHMMNMIVLCHYDVYDVCWMETLPPRDEWPSPEVNDEYCCAMQSTSEVAAADATGWNVNSECVFLKQRHHE